MKKRMIIVTALIMGTLGAGCVSVQASDTLPELTKDNALEQMMKAGETDSLVSNHKSYEATCEYIPNCIGQIVVTTCLQIPSAIFLESFLSYLGVGVSAPLPSLGSMATDALSGMYTYTYRLIVPSVVLSVMILAFNLFGDGLRDALDPKLKK